MTRPRKTQKSKSRNWILFMIRVYIKSIDQMIAVEIGPYKGVFTLQCKVIGVNVEFHGIVSRVAIWRHRDVIDSHPRASSLARRHSVEVPGRGLPTGSGRPRQGLGGRRQDLS